MNGQLGVTGMGAGGGYGVLTIQQHILQEQQKFPEASGEFSWLLSGITLATKQIQAKVRRAGLTDILGAHESGAENPHGEVQQNLDVFANHAIMRSLAVRDSVATLVSEENDRPVMLRHSTGQPRYAVIFDPLDGSSNIDVNVSVGTIFSILRLPATIDSIEEGLLQPGRAQVAAGYVLYGSSTVLVYTAGNGVHGFTLDPSIGAYVLSHENIRMPERGKYYSVNEAYRDAFPRPYREYLERLRKGEFGRPYASRYIGSLVADFHRTLLKGGVFLYPPTAEHRQGKLRLLYEVNPIAYLAEQAGGSALDGTEPILKLRPTGIHQRVPLVVGSRFEMQQFEPYRARLREEQMVFA